MAKVRGPLLSIGATGGLGDLIVFQRNRAGLFARTKTKPITLASLAQKTARAEFKALLRIWKLLPEEGREPWRVFVKYKRSSALNAFLTWNLPLIRGATNMSPFESSRTTRSGEPMTDISATDPGGSGEVRIFVSWAGYPPGWSLDDATAVYFPDFDPSSELPETVKVERDNWTGSSGTMSIRISGVTPNVLYMYACFFRWLKPNGELAYSNSLGIRKTVN